MNLSLHLVSAILLILARVAGMISTAPVFSRKDVFSMAKVAFVFWLTASLVFAIPIPRELPNNVEPFVLLFISQFLVGVIIGLIADLLVVAVEFAGSLMDTQAGLSVAALLDPSTGRSIPLLSQTLNWVAILIFLQLNGHHMVITTLVKSFDILPIAMPLNFTKGSQMVFSLGTELFKVGLIISAPILLVMFIVDFAFGLLNKIAEQINIFQLGFQVKPSVGLLVFLAITPGLTDTIYKLMEMLTEKTFEVLIALQV